MIEKKYVKPKSVAWWAGFIPLIAGVFMATEELHQLAKFTNVVREASGGMSAFALINLGLAVIGLRGAV